MAKHTNFESIFEGVDKSPAYLTERAVLEFTETLVARMERDGVTRAELARRIGSTPAYVTKILRGTTNFTLESMVRIASALGCEFRTHLQPEGARSQWFDVLEGDRQPEQAYQNCHELQSDLQNYVPCVNKPVQEVNDDSLAAAS